MGLNAAVYCDDVERGNLRIPHPLPHLLFIDEIGCPSISSDNPQDALLHDQWEAQRPCQHENFFLVEHWLGNAWLISRIHEIVERISSNPSVEFPILCTKVIYSGVHSGDHLNVEEVLQLDGEINRLRKVESVTGEERAHFDDFLTKLEELVRASLSVKKPISF